MDGIRNYTWRLILALLLCGQVCACTLVVKAVDHVNPDPEEDRRGAYKRGMAVAVVEDGYNFGTDEVPAAGKFVHIHFPLVPANRALKYVREQLDQNGDLYRRRLWQIRWLDLPLAARNKLRDNGSLTIKATDAYTGPYDYTWDQIKTFFRNLETGLDETDNL